MEENLDDPYNIDIYDDEVNNDINIFLTNIFNSISHSTVMDLFTSMIEEQIMEEVMEESLEQQKTLEKTETIINIEKIKYKDLNNCENYNKQCSICITDFENEDEISLTDCKHVFHNKCIVEWGSYKQECPICRTNI